MSNLLKQRGVWSRFKEDTHGNFAVVWAIGLTTTMLAVGAGIDLTTASRVSTTAQAAADQVALTSAVFYSQHQRLPENSEEGFVDGQLYRGDDAGYTFPNSVSGGSKRVKIRANYDEENGEVVVEVSGKVRTSFMGLFNARLRTLPFKNVSTANFKEIALKNPASITLVLDNSGSMSWDDKPAECEWEWDRSRWRWVEKCEAPNDAEPRIDGLKDSVENFMDLLDGYVGPQNVTGKRVLRTGMIPYDDQIINSREVNMDWGLISNSEIDKMVPSGATNSAPPIAKAWEWLNDENDEHEAENGEDNPLRYMIFMTDGQNSAPKQWFKKDGTEYWRGVDCSRGGRYCYYTYRSSPTRPNIEDHYNWEEGERISSSDRDSKNSCAAMKAQGVRVFTIGFALEPGTYKTNYPSSWNRDWQKIGRDTTDAAYSMLADCASSPDDFVAAEDAETLDDAFSMIGETIVQDVIRLSQ